MSEKSKEINEIDYGDYIAYEKDVIEQLLLLLDLIELKGIENMRNLATVHDTLKLKALKLSEK